MSEIEETGTMISEGYQGLDRTLYQGCEGLEQQLLGKVTTGGLIDSVLNYDKFTTGYLQQPGKYPATTGPQKRSYRSTVLYYMTPGPYRYW